MTPQAYCRKICRQSGSNFVPAFHFLSRERRQAFEACYAFCRLVDDVVDEAKAMPAAEKKLAEWEQEITRVYEGNPTHPVGIALAPIVAAHDIPQKYFQEIIAGCRMDLTQKRYQTLAELELYCYRVACSVGLVSLYLFGVEPTETTKQAAIALGKAVQLTNILRDLVADRKRGRIYIPQAYFRQFGISCETLESKEGDRMRLAELILFVGKQAKAFYAVAWAGFPPDLASRRKLTAALLMGKTYETLLEKITRKPLQVLSGKVSLSTWEKFTIARQVMTQLYLSPWISKRS